jgi:hypothetical protein
MQCPYTRGAAKYVGTLIDVAGIVCTPPLDASDPNCYKSHALQQYMQLYGVNMNGVRFTYNNSASCPALDSQELIISAGAHCPHVNGMKQYISNAGPDVPPSDGACPPLSETLDPSTVDTGCARTIAI